MPTRRRWPGHAPMPPMPPPPPSATASWPEKQLISTQDLDNALASERSTAAAVKQAQADVESAQLDLGYATVTAPIAGRAGRSQVTEGALVGQGEATQLTDHRADRSGVCELQSLGERAA